MMKTKKILTAVALPLMLAACSQDAELESALNQGDYSNIPTVDVNFTASTSEDTRMATQFGWEVGDKIGLAWLGDATILTSNSDGKAYQNHPMFCTNAATGAFKTETMLYVGTYFAYLPYSEKTVSVENIPFTTEGQVLSTNVNDYAKNLIYITPAMTKLVEEATEATDEEAGLGKNIQLNLDRISNAVTLNLTFGNATGLTDLKVLGVSVDLQDNSADDASILAKSFDHKRITAETKNWNQLEPGEVVAFFGTNTATAGAIKATSTTGLAVENGKLTTYLLTLPSTVATAADDELVITVTTNYGDVVINSASSKIGQTADPAIVIKEGKVEKIITTSGILNKLGQSGTIDVYVDMKNASFDESVITSQTDLTNALNAIAAVGVTTSVELKLARPTATSSAAFVLTDFTMPEGLKAPITLSCGDNVSAIEFAGDAVINKSLTLGTSTNATVTGNMIVKVIKSGGTAQTTLNLGANTLTVAAGATLTNEGVIADGGSGVFVTDAASSSPAKAAGKYISNSADAKCTANTFTNNGEIQWVAGTVPSTTGTIYAEVSNFQDLIAANTAQVTTVRFMNEVEFNNSNASLTFSGITTIECYKPVTMNILKNTLSGVCTIDFAVLTKIEIKSGAAFNVVSDDKGNIFDMGGTSPVINVAANSELNFNKVTLAGASVTVNYAGKVTLTDVTDGDIITSKENKGGGTWSEINN